MAQNYRKRSAQALLQDVLEMEVDDADSREDENDDDSDDLENLEEILSDNEDLSVNSSGSESGDDNENESETENDDNVWRQVRDTDFTLDTVEFSVRKTGVQIPAANIPNTVIGMFQLYFTEELSQNFVDETNRQVCKYKDSSSWSTQASFHTEEVVRRSNGRDEVESF
jgi:hypothetical protein